MTASNTVFTVFSGIGFIISLIPLTWHLEARNVGTCVFMIWTALTCLVHCVDSIIWSGNTVNWAPVWCDISVRIAIGASVAWPACVLCITRRLYHIISATVGTTTRSEIRRETIVGLLITIGIPALEMLVELTVAARRFDIYEDYGCHPHTYNTPLAYVFVWSWPLILGLVSASYGVLTIRTFIRRRREFRDLIATNANLTYSCYWRLVALSSVDFCFSIPISLWTIIDAVSEGVNPWISWADTHEKFQTIIQYPRSSYQNNTMALCSLELSRWDAVLCAFVFFGFFGFVDEARKNYRLWMRFLEFPSRFLAPRQ